MGLMELPVAGPGQLIVTPHAALLDGQRNVVWEARPGESLYALLMRNVPELDGQPWAVSIGGVVVERHLWHCVYPKQGQVVEVRGGVGKTALMVVALIALTYFTMGFGAATTGMWGAGAVAANYGAVVAMGVYMAGSMLINKVLGPKPPKASSQSQDSVYSLSGARNQLRQYEPLPLLFGRVRITPDLLSKPYTWYEGNDQYLGLLLCAGVNVGRVEDLYNGDTLLSSYEGTQVFHSGYSQMPDQQIPVYSNADVIDGGQLLDTSTDPKHTPSAWIERTSSTDTVRLIVGLEYQLYDKTSKGKDKNNTERVEIQYRAVGTINWQPFGTYALNSSKTKAYRAGYSKDVPAGQYDVRVRTAGFNTDGSGAQAAFTWTTLTSVQKDEADYTGLSRTGIKLKATGQLNGTPDELRAVGYADPISVWDGSQWTTAESSNPGAQILAYARGLARGGRLLGGMALVDEQIDIESLKAFTLHCAANSYSYDHYVKDARSHEQVLSAIALAGFGQITWAGGRLGVVWAAQDQPLSGVVNMGVIKKGQFQVDYNLSNAADGIEYTYLDGTTWETKTLRVPAPGVTTMLNPAQVSGEGVSTEEHAARLARWHLAQSLYQYKDISYSTDIEHLSYQRLSILAMQHDMTQWGFGGRVVAAVNDAGYVTLTLDEPVPAPTSGLAYIGLRIPGERVYRVLRVDSFVGESRQITLAERWPDDAALPGGVTANPAHDTLWIYDFKQTPGLRVRVVSVTPESDLKGAAVRVVAEGPEFWQYVLTGHYLPSPSGSLLQTRPVASNLVITEQQVVQGNTAFTELSATFDVTGPVGHIVVRAAADGQELEEVAQTQTRTATWRIPDAGAYNIVVRPYSPDGEPGLAVSGTYVTAGADVPPVLVDLFEVEQRSGGVRLYTWGWLSGTIQSPDFAGVEIRYLSGAVTAPEWEAMTPVGDSGYHTAAFEAVVPESGEWTFACRSRNSAGVLSADMRVITRQLTANLGEQIGGIGEDLDAITEEQLAQQEKLDREVEDRVQGDLANATAIAEEVADRAEAVANEATARANAIAAETAARTAAINASAAASAESLLNARLALEASITNEANIRQSADSSLAQQIATVSAGTGEQFDTGGGIWYFDTAAEGWTAISSAGLTVVDGWLRPDFSNNATQNVQSPLLTFDSTSYRYVKFRLRKVGNPGAWRGWVRWVTAADQTYDTAKQVSIAEPTFDSNGIATVDFKDIPWPAGVTRVRIYPYSGMTSAGNYVEYDWIALGRPSPGASAAALQEERTARISGDAAEATQRTTLAAQLRGNYTGNDPAQLQSGLIYAERQVRITAEGVIATDVSNLQARMPAGSGGLATAASVTAEATARASADSALSERSSVMESRMPAGAGGLATAASVDTVANSVTTVDGKVSANTDSLNKLSVAMEGLFTVQNGSFETTTGTVGWGTDGLGANNTLPASSQYWTNAAAHGNVSLRLNGSDAAPTRAWYNAQLVDLRGIRRVWLSLDTQTVAAPATGAQFRVGMRFYDKDGAVVSNLYAPIVTATGTTWLFGTNKAEGFVAVPATAVSGRVLVYTQGLAAGGAILFDDVRCVLENAPTKATVDALSTTQIEVGQQGGQIAAQGNRLQTIEARLPGGTGGLATSASVTSVEQASVNRDEALSSRTGAVEARMPAGNGGLATAASVTSADQAAATATAAVAIQVAQVKVTADNAAASIATVSEVVAGSSPVVVVNPSFELGYGWSAATSGAGNLPAEAVYTDVTGGAGARTGTRVLRINGNTTLYNQGRTSVRTGEQLRLGMYMRNIGTTPNAGVARRLGFRGYDAAGAYVAGSALWTVNNSTATANTWPSDPQSGIYTVPAGVVSIGVMIQIASMTSGSLAVDDIVVERLTSDDIRAMARVTNVLDVNGNISGTVSDNDGVRSSFSVLASVFRVLTGGTASGMEWQANYLRVYGSGYQYVIGTGFGASNNLVQWVGPNIGVAACTIANCSQAVTTAGETIIRGSTGAGRMEISPTAIKVYDTVNSLPRIELGL